jgi:phage terminase large subunit-like protein
VAKGKRTPAKPSAGAEDKDLHPAEKYARDVEAGNIVACKWIRLAVKRHLRDLKTAHKRGLYFDRVAAEHAIEFFGFLHHSKGEWAGQVFTLEPWQQFKVWMLFGWRQDNGTRRFRTCYTSIARKNGKTTEMSGVGLYLLDADDEPGAEVYSAATKRDQARLSHGEAVRMVKKSPMLQRRIRVFRDNLSVEATNSKFEPLGRDADTMDGLNIHGALVDELHAHPTRDVWDVLETATGARRQPLLYAITTAGSDRQTICGEIDDYARAVLEGRVEDDSFLAFIYTLDEKDDWLDEEVWPKANPNLDISVKRDDLRRKVRKAREIPAAANSFLRLHLNVWTASEARWFGIGVWERCGQVLVEEDLRGRECFGGIDLASTSDFNAWVLAFPREDGVDVLARFFIPEAAVKNNLTMRDQYVAWAKQGHLNITPGDVSDQDFIEAAVLEDARRFQIREIGYDPWNSTQLAVRLADEGLAMVEVRQGYRTLNEPAKLLEKLILTKKLNHGGSPVLSWMAGNVQLETDPAGNIKPSKKKSRAKIDGVVALVTALERMMHQEAALTPGIEVITL